MRLALLLLALLAAGCTYPIEGPPRIVIHENKEVDLMCIRDVSQSDTIANYMEGADSSLSCERGQTRLDGWCEVAPDLHAPKVGMFLNISASVGTNGWECNASGTGKLIVHVTCTCD